MWKWLSEDDMNVAQRLEWMNLLMGICKKHGEFMKCNGEMQEAQENTCTGIWMLLMTGAASLLRHGLSGETRAYDIILEILEWGQTGLPLCFSILLDSMAMGMLTQTGINKKQYCTRLVNVLVTLEVSIEVTLSLLQPLAPSKQDAALLPVTALWIANAKSSEAVRFFIKAFQICKTQSNFTRVFVKCGEAAPHVVLILLDFILQEYAEQKNTALRRLALDTLRIIAPLTNCFSSKLLKFTLQHLLLATDATSMQKSLSALEAYLPALSDEQETIVRDALIQVLVQSKYKSVNSKCLTIMHTMLVKYDSCTGSDDEKLNRYAKTTTVYLNSTLTNTR